MTEQDAKDVIAFVVELLRGWRGLKNYGLREVSSISGISIATLSRMERGGVPDAITFIRLVNLLKKQAALKEEF